MPLDVSLIYLNEIRMNRLCNEKGDEKRGLQDFAGAASLPLFLSQICHVIDIGRVSLYK
jgi:hypothetical protein